MKKNKIIIKQAKNKQTFIVVKGGNNETIVTGETYKSKQGAKRGIAALKKVLKNAVVIDRTKKKGKS